ncbi:unnamed protein product [Urochloa humidicola]
MGLGGGRAPRFPAGGRWRVRGGGRRPRHGAGGARSAKCLATAPHLIRKVHLDYLEAGANILTSASYQATIEGFQSRGFSREELLRRSVHVAAGGAPGSRGGRQEAPALLGAASVGSYGAYLADGSEYSGDYGRLVTKEVLKSFHRRRLQVLADAGPDLIAFETIPNKLEAQAYAELLESDIRIPAWFSFTSKDGTNTASGDLIAECAAVADSCQRVSAVGVNCTAPRPIHGFILSIKKITEQTDRRVPQQRRDVHRRDERVGGARSCTDTTGASGPDFVSCVGEWRKAGAALIGGCCRTSPATVRAIARALPQADADEYDDVPAVAVL